MRLVSLRTHLAVSLLLAIACSDAALDPKGIPGGGGGNAGSTASGGAASGGTEHGGTAGGAGANVAGRATSGRGGTDPTGGVSTGGAGQPAIGGGASGASARGGNAAAGAPSAGAAASGAGDGGTGAGGTAGNSQLAGASGDGGQPHLPAGVVALFPPPGATSVCPDPQIRITFAAPPTLGTSGQVRIFDEEGSAVASVNMASANVTEMIGGQAFSIARRAFVDGNTAVIYLPSRALAYGESYSVTLGEGTIVAPDGSPFAITAEDAWRFSTADGPPSDLTTIEVALTGGDFCSVQGALDAVPNANATPTRITLAAGTYHEIIYASAKNHVTLRGAGRKTTLIAATNNETTNGGTKNRALVGFDGSSDLVIENLTIHNLTPQGGSQAEALRLQNCNRCVVRDADLLSLQDTLLFSGSVYLKNCYVEGNVDFVWGTGTAYFDQCEIKTVGRQGVVVQARNSASGYGYVFVDSRITSDPGLGNSTLARIDVSAYPASHVAYVDCTLGSHITAAGWTITGGSPGAQLRFWEYRSRDLAGNLVDTSRRSAGSKQLSETEAAGMRDKARVLGGWTPPD